MQRPFLPVAAALLLRALPALASGLGIPDLGAAAVGSGAANIAAPSDLTAIYYNPASLVRTKGLRFQLDLRTVQHEFSFQRTDADGNPRFSDDADFPRVENRGGVAFSPMIVAAWQSDTLWKRPLAFALGGHPATGYSGYKFPDPFALRADPANPAVCRSCDDEAVRQAPQRYTLVTATPLSYTLALAGSVEVTKELALGITLQNPLVRFRTRQALAANPFATTEQFGYDAPLEIDASDWFTFQAALGATYALPKGIHLGASFQLPANVNATGKLKITPPRTLVTTRQAKVVGDDVDLLVKLPYFARLGARIVRPAWEAELGFTWDGWSRYDEVVLTPHNVSFVTDEGTPQEIRIAVPQIRLVKGMQDAQSVRLGGLFRPSVLLDGSRALVLRAGGLYETSAIPDERIALDQAHWERFAASVGLGFDAGTFAIDVGWTHYFQADKEIRNSLVVQSAPLRKDKGDEPIVIGNGNYHSQLDVVGVAISTHFDR